MPLNETHLGLIALIFPEAPIIPILEPMIYALGYTIE
jgi:hypothetical protein